MDPSDPLNVNIESPPDDGVSAVHFSPTSSNHLLVSSWDSHVRLYDIEANSVKASFQHQAAVLACAFDTTGKRAYSGGLDTHLRRFDLETETTKIFGSHTATVSNVLQSTDPNVIITGSWDRTLRLWDARHGNDTALISSHEQPERVYAMDSVGHMLVVACAGRRVNIYDTRSMEKPLHERISTLKFTTSAVACMNDGQGYATASVEGRVAVDYFDTASEIQAKKYAFKCHRQPIAEGDLVSPVNALVFHPTHNTFASGGSDGTLALWDHTAKKRLRLYPRFHTGVSAIAFSSKDVDGGARMAVGISYNWDVVDEKRRDELRKANGGVYQTEKIAVVVRNVGDEVKPKAKAA